MKGVSRIAPGTVRRLIFMFSESPLLFDTQYLPASLQGGLELGEGWGPSRTQAQLTTEGQLSPLCAGRAGLSCH